MSIGSRSRPGFAFSGAVIIGLATVALGWLVLGEVPPALALAGGALSIAGVIVARSRSGRRGQRGASP